VGPPSLPRSRHRAELAGAMTAGGPLQAYTDPESGLVVAPIAVSRALELVDVLPCAVHLLPHFRRAELAKFQKADLDTHLSGSNKAGSRDTNGILLYTLEHGRRGIVTLHCKLLCVEDMSVSAGRALLLPTAIMQKATRVSAKINKRDKKQFEFWCGLGFEIGEDTAELAIDAQAIAAHRAAQAERGMPPQADAADEAPAPPDARPSSPRDASIATAGSFPVKKKRGRPSKAEMASREVGSLADQEQEPPPPLPPPARQRAGKAPRVQDPGADAYSRLPISTAAERQPSKARKAPPAPPALPLGVASSSAAMDPMEAAVLADDGGDDETSDVYIRRTCPSTEFAHLVRVPSGARPPNPGTWLHVPEEELERAQTVQCRLCERVLLLARDQAEDFVADANEEDRDA